MPGMTRTTNIYLSFYFVSLFAVFLLAPSCRGSIQYLALAAWTDCELLCNAFGRTMCAGPNIPNVSCASRAQPPIVFSRDRNNLTKHCLIRQHCSWVAVLRGAIGCSHPLLKAHDWHALDIRGWGWHCSLSIQTMAYSVIFMHSSEQLNNSTMSRTWTVFHRVAGRRWPGPVRIISSRLLRWLSFILRSYILVWLQTSTA